MAVHSFPSLLYVFSNSLMRAHRLGEWAQRRSVSYAVIASAIGAWRSLHCPSHEPCFYRHRERRRRVAAHSLFFAAITPEPENREWTATPLRGSR